MGRGERVSTSGGGSFGESRSGDDDFQTSLVFGADGRLDVDATMVTYERNLRRAVWWPLPGRRRLVQATREWLESVRDQGLLDDDAHGSDV